MKLLTLPIMNKRIMKKLVLFSLATVASLAVSMNAATVAGHSAESFPAVSQITDVRTPKVSDPFAGITLSKEQKEKIDLILNAVKNTRVENEESRKALSRKTMFQIKKVLTAEQYVKFLENIADSQMYLPVA